MIGKGQDRKRGPKRNTLASQYVGQGLWETTSEDSSVQRFTQGQVLQHQ